MEWIQGKAAMSMQNVLPELTRNILGCAIDVHRELGPGLLESAYRACLLHCLTQAGMEARCEVPVPIRFRGLNVETSYRADIIVEGKALVELKAVDRLLPIHTMQALTYLQLSELPVGLLINFNVPVLMNGVKRLVRNSRPHVAAYP